MCTQQAHFFKKFQKIKKKWLEKGQFFENRENNASKVFLETKNEFD